MWLFNKKVRQEIARHYLQAASSENEIVKKRNEKANLLREIANLHRRIDAHRDGKSTQVVQNKEFKQREAQIEIINEDIKGFENLVRASLHNINGLKWKHSWGLLLK
jgi:uncharacterized membrane-anchored protein YhcB (DUF1043 family)